jgi:hypothetical protein
MYAAHYSCLLSGKIGPIFIYLLHSVTKAGCSGKRSFQLWETLKELTAVGYLITLLVAGQEVF